MNLSKELKPNNEFYSSVLDVIHDKAANILNTPKHFHYTDHTISHSERILAIISSLISKTDVELADEEKVVLVAATLLHDIGMQAPSRYTGLTHTPETLEDLELIRKKHHEYSEMIIMDSVSGKSLTDEDKPYDFGLSIISDFAEDISIVAKYHRKLDINAVEEDYINGSAIRMKLLCSLIRIGDGLDFDQRRVDINRLSIFSDIPMESKFFWFCHYYVSALTTDNRKITINFKLPLEYKQTDIAECIIKHIKSDIDRQINEVYEILDNNGIRLYKEPIISKHFSASKQSMPTKLADYALQTYINKQTFRSVKFAELNIHNRDELIDAYIKSLENTMSFRNILTGPLFLSPKWYRERVMANSTHQDFDSIFYSFVKENSRDSVNTNIKLILRNTPRYFAKIQEYLSIDEYNTFFSEVLQRIDELWGTDGSKGPLLCCVDPGYMQLLTISDSVGITTHRLGVNEPTRQGYITHDKDEIRKMKDTFDSMFEFNYTSQIEEIEKLKHFIKSLMEKNKGL